MNRSRRWYLLVGGLMVGAILFIALFADYITPVSPYYMDARESIMEGAPPFGISDSHPLGTDQFGRDIWSRVAYGARWSLFFAFLIMSVRMLVAVPMAVLSAFGPRLAGWMTGRLYVYTSSIPPLLIYLLILSAPGLDQLGLWPSVALTVLLLTLVEWPRLAVSLKGRMEELANEQFVEGAVAAGATPWHIFWRHLMPHLWPTLMNMMVAEMGRSLLNIAQLGVFGIFMGGGIKEMLENSRGMPVIVTTTGIPEWGTLLANARIYIYQAPWIPTAPAFAFFVGVVGFNLLAQGLEGAVFSVSRLKEATTSRLSARWRWALLIVPVLITGWYYKGLPWGQEAAIAALAERQAAALTNRSVEEFVATLDPAKPAYRDDQANWVTEALEGDFQVAMVRPSGINVDGDEATAFWIISIGFEDRPPISLRRSVRLVNRWGQWYETGEALTGVRGVHIDLDAFYNPLDPSVESVSNRYNVHFVATAADHAYRRAASAFPGGVGTDRPQLKLHSSDESFRAALMDLPAGANIWYEPGGLIEVSPAFLKGFNRRNTINALTFEMVKYLTTVRLGGNPGVMPVVTGALEIELDGGGTYRIDFDRLADSPLFTLQQMLRTGPNELPQERQQVYKVQSALLVEYLDQQIPREKLFASIQGQSDVLAALAKALNKTDAELAAGFEQYARQRISEASVLNVPAGRERIPLALTDAVSARAQAAVTGSAEAFLAWAAPSARSSQSAWLSSAAGLKGYETHVLEMDQKDGATRIYVLERITLSDGSVHAGVSIQHWVEQEDGTWLLSSPGTGLTLAGR